MMANVIRNGTFYGIWPVLDGKGINYQWGEIRSNTAETKAIVRSSVQELEDGIDELNALRSLLGLSFGDLDFSNKFRFYYDQTTEELCCQKNDGTVESPIWTDAWCVRFHDGQFQVVSTGGIQSAAGFYGSGLQSIEEVAESGTGADVSIRNPTKIFFNVGDGLSVEEIAAGANKGQPEIRFSQPFGQAQKFSKSGRVWRVDHNYGLTPVLVQVMDADDRVVIPDVADVSDENTAWFYFNDSFTGSVYIASGGVGAASLVPRDPFYLVVRHSGQSASPDNLFKPNCDLIFDERYFYVNPNQDEDAGGAHKEVFVSLSSDTIGVDLTDGENVFPSTDKINFNHDRFYLTSDSEGKPVVNSRFLDSVRFEAHVRVDDSVYVENAVTAEAFYLAPGSGGELSKSENDVKLASKDGDVIIDDDLQVTGAVQADDTIYVENAVTAEAFYVKAGYELSSEILKAPEGNFSGYVNVDDSVYVENIVTAEAFYVKSGHELGCDGLITSDGNFSGYVNVDDSVYVENIVTAEAFYVKSGNELGPDGLHVNDIDASGYVNVDDSVYVENIVTAEAFYLASGGEISKSGDDVILASSVGDVIIDDCAKITDCLVIGEDQTYATGVKNLIEIPDSVIQDGEGGNINVLSGLSSSALTKINSAQTLTSAATFVDRTIFRETGAIAGSHTLLQKIGVQATPTYQIGHDGTSTAAVPTFCGIGSSPIVKRKSGNTGNVTVTEMSGFNTNPLNPLIAFVSAQQINAGFTITKYAHFIAHSDVSGGLVKTGGTITTEIGLDLQNINLGTTCISINSTATGATMRHRGKVSLGTTSTPSVSLGGTAYAPKLYVESNDGDMYEWIVAKYDNTNANHLVYARARGTLASPSAIATGNTIFSTQGWGYTNGSFWKATSFNSEVDDTVGVQDVPGAFVFKVHGAGTGVNVVDIALNIRSNLTMINSGHRGYASTGIFSGTLSGNVNDYASYGEKGIWRINCGAANRTITGILAPAAPSTTDFLEITIINVSAAAADLILADEDAGSVAANRIITGTGSDWTISPDEAAHLIYDNVTDRWRIISHHP